MAGYGSDDGFTAYAAANGYTVPAGSIPAARARGSIYIDGTYGIRFPGTPTGGIDQERAWPRTGATDWYGNVVDASTVPASVINASYEAALLELTTPGSLSAVVTGAGRVTMERVEGAVTVQYAAPSGKVDLVCDNTPTSTLIAGILAPLLVPAFLPAVVVV